MLRSTTAIHRATLRHVRPSQRFLHEDSTRGPDFLAFSLSRSAPRSNSGFGMDMTRAPGYEVAADEEPPLVGNQKLADFAARHARLSTSQIAHARGYMWVGSVLYPSGYSTDSDLAFTWETIDNDDSTIAQSTSVSKEETVANLDDEIEVVNVTDDNQVRADTPVAQTKRRYTSGQARRIRREREKVGNRKSRRNAKILRRAKDNIEDNES